MNEKNIQRGEVLKMSAIADHYKKLQLSNLLEVKECINRNLKSRLVTAFGDELSFFQKKEKTAEIVYGSREDITPLSDEEKTNDIAKLIKDEIVSSIKDSKWPPNPETIRDQNIKIPKLLETFLKTLLSKETTESDRVQRLVKSIGQDIIYNVTREKTKTVKHTQLGTFVKRITGSRLIIDCLNRLGHTISYHEVNSLETAFAEVQVHHQLFQSYVPPSVHPSMFVTFVYDNCDHNPESLSGVSMHVTNGIIIQLSNRNNELLQIDEANTPIIEKRKSFIPMETDILPYKAAPRLHPPILPDIDRNENFMSEYLSRKSDLLWLLLRSQSYIVKQEQNVPGWSGFYYEVCIIIFEKFSNFCFCFQLSVISL